MKIKICSSISLDDIKNALNNGTSGYDGMVVKLTGKCYIIRMNANKSLPIMRGIKQSGDETNVYNITFHALNTIAKNYNFLNVEF